MAISDVIIGNMALSFVGAKRSIVTALTDDNAGAEAVNLWYEYARLSTLEAYNWSFARKRLTLAVHADAPPDEWAFRYTYPSGIVAIRSIWNPLGESADAVPYDTELIAAGTARCILTNMEDAIAICTADITTTSLFSPTYVIAFARKIAECIAFTLTGKESVRDAQTQHFNFIIQQAAALDAQQVVKGPPRDSDWIRGRK